ncbi:MAG: hypothetical protein IPL87_01535 [Candidatus Moraniibacteriota bacterium]|nr:MAG: hypothetical protein IPL87_01535 [Candidatus Moranbacteria bacterium]
MDLSHLDKKYFIDPEERKERFGVLGQMKSIFANSKNPPEETISQEEVKE